MRFALMIEPQQGLTLRGAARGRAAGRGRRFRDALPARPLRELPRRAGEPTTDAWAVLAGLARDTTTIGLGRAGVAGDLPHARATSPRSSSPSTR